MPHTLCGFARLRRRAFVPPPFAAAFCALRVLPPRGPCPGARPLRRGAPGPRFAAPVRRFRPRCARRGRPSGAAPRLSRSARVRRCAAPWALAGPAALGLALAALRPPCSVGLASSRASPCASRVPRRVPPAPARFAASGPVASRPGACAALWAACSGLRPRGFGCAPAPARACWVRSPWLRWWSGASPPRPSRPRRPRWGLRGCAWPPAWGLPPPALRASPCVSGCFPMSGRRSPIVPSVSRLPFGGALPRP